MSRSPSDQSLHAYVNGLLAIYQIERQDQQTSGNQSRALIGTGLAYAAGVAALMNSAVADGGQIDPLVVMAAPLPLVALISLLVLSIGNVQQRAKYLVRLEQELEPHMSRPAASGPRKHRVTVPNGFRRSQYVFRPLVRTDDNDPLPEGGASVRLRKFGSIAMGALTTGAMLLTEIGLIGYAVHLADGWRAVAAGGVYGACIGLQAIGWYIALRPGMWEDHGAGREEGTTACETDIGEGAITCAAGRGASA